MNTQINWNDVVKKEAKGIMDAELGKVQEVSNGLILVQRGTLNKEIFSIPQNKVESYDGKVLRFTISEEEALSKYKKLFEPNKSKERLTKEEINWNDVVKKEAKGIMDAELGKVQEVSNGLILVQRGTLNKEIFSIPQNKVESYDGKVLRFTISEEEALSKYKKLFEPNKSS